MSLLPKRLLGAPFAGVKIARRPRLSARPSGVRPRPSASVRRRRREGYKGRGRIEGGFTVGFCVRPVIHTPSSCVENNKPAQKLQTGESVL